MKRFWKYDVVLFGLLMLFLFVPVVQQVTGVFTVKPLKGHFDPAPKPEWSFESYKANAYQQQLEKYTSENFGLHEPVIRIYNQYLWSAYRKTYCHFITPGKKGWLYYTAAIDDYYGKEVPKQFLTNADAIAHAESEVLAMDSLRKVLKTYGVEFLAFLAPDKTLVYPEYLPRRDADTMSPKMAEYFDRRMTELGFPHINMTNWFVAMKDTASFALFPKTDSHWRYSAVYGFDSLFRFMNTLDGPDFPTLHIGKTTAYTSDKKNGDEETLNLLFSIRGGDVQYKSDLKVEADSTQRKPRVLFVGDSFIWGLDNNLPAEELVESRDVWFYNKTAFEGFKNTMSKVNEINRLRHILKADYVVFYLVGHQWWKATCGFATDALQLFNQATEAEILEARQMNAIEFDEEWFSQLKVYASQHGIALEEALRGEADNVLENKALFREGIVVDTAILIQMKKEEIIKKWRNSPDQMRMFEQKAKDRKLTVEEMLEKDAQWVVDRQMEKGELF